VTNMTKRSAEEMEALAERVEAWADTVDPRNLQEVPIGELRAITSLADTVHEAEAALASAVDRARSWSQIGTALGVSKQAAQQRYGTPVSH
jgi:hypothetical protein